MSYFYKKSTIKKHNIVAKKIMDYGMGFIYTCVGLILLLSSPLGLRLSFPVPPWTYFFGVLICAYGGFRIYRAYQLK